MYFRCQQGFAVRLVEGIDICDTLLRRGKLQRLGGLLPGSLHGRRTWVELAQSTLIIEGLYKHWMARSRASCHCRIAALLRMGRLKYRTATGRKFPAQTSYFDVIATDTRSRSTNCAILRLPKCAYHRRSSSDETVTWPHEVGCHLSLLQHRATSINSDFS